MAAIVVVASDDEQLLVVPCEEWQLGNGYEQLDLDRAVEIVKPKKWNAVATAYRRAAITLNDAIDRAVWEVEENARSEAPKVS